VRVLADGQTHRQTDRQTQTDFIICPMLYAIAMGQITKASKLNDSTRADSIDKTAMLLSMESHIVLRK